MDRKGAPLPSSLRLAFSELAARWSPGKPRYPADRPDGGAKTALSRSTGFAGPELWVAAVTKSPYRRRPRQHRDQAATNRSLSALITFPRKPADAHREVSTAEAQAQAMGLVHRAWVRSSGGLRLCDREWQRRGDGLRPRYLDDRLRALAKLAGDSERPTQKPGALMHPADSQSRSGQTLQRRPQVFRGRGVLPNVVKDAAHVRQHATDACLHAVELAENAFPAHLVCLEDLHLQEEEVQGLADVVVELPGKVNVPPRS